MNGQEKICECGQGAATAEDEFADERHEIESVKRQGAVLFKSVWNVVVRDRVSGAKTMIQVPFTSGDQCPGLDLWELSLKKGGDPGAVEVDFWDVADAIMEELWPRHFAAVKRFKAAIRHGSRGAQSPARSKDPGDQRS